MKLAQCEKRCLFRFVSLGKNIVLLLTGLGVVRAAKILFSTGNGKLSFWIKQCESGSADREINIWLELVAYAVADPEGIRSDRSMVRSPPT